MRFAASLLSLAFFAALVAGCISDGTDHGHEDGDGALPRAFLVCAPASDVPAAPAERGNSGSLACNFPATVSPESRQANELSIAVNPMDPLNLIATGKDYTPDYAGDCVWDGLYWTKDGGRTWGNMNLPGSNWKRLSDPMEPVTNFSRFWCATDPVVAFGPDGTAYWAVMPYQCDRLSGSKTGRDILPDGGFNDWFWTCSAMYVLVSEDGGETWPIVREVAFGARLEHDKQWISVSPSGKVLLCWDRATDAASMGTPANQLDPGQSIMVCSVSTDKGRTWTDMRTVNEGWAGFLPWVDWDANDQAWMAAVDGSHVIVSHSRDGLDWSAPVEVGNYTDPPAGGEYGWPVVAGSDFRIFAVPSLAVDRSDGPWGGTVYVVWFDHSRGDGEVLLTASRDGGATWAPPKRVHDDPVNSTTDQFMPAVAVGPDGTVDVTWYDRRMDPKNHLFDLFHTYSLDGGETFAANLRVSEVSSDEQYSHHQNGMVFLGDYIDLDSSAGQAHAVWVDTRDRTAEVYVARIQRPSANFAPEE